MLFLTLLVSFAYANAETQLYRATSLAINAYNYNTYQWTGWTDWEKCNINIIFDTDEEMVVIYSNKKQVYRIFAEATAPYDASGKQIAFKVVDQDNDRGTLRLRVENNGNSQIYIDFADIRWVYNVYRVQ